MSDGSRRLSDPTSPPPLALLSGLYGTVGRFHRGRALLRRLRVRSLARRWLLRTVLEPELRRPCAVTVLIGIRDRADHRLANALASIRAQTLPPQRVRILVVDYGSRAAAAAHIQALCRHHDATLIRVPDAPVWSRSRCLNVGIRRVTTPFVMTSDADVLLSPGYLEEAVAAIRAEPQGVVVGPMLDLREDSLEEVRGAADAAGPLPLERWRKQATPRLDWDFHPSITVTFSACHRLIRGYDEFYQIWGCEDLDQLRRLQRLGLEPQLLDSSAFYLHQWHPKYENVPEAGRPDVLRRNAEYLDSTWSILRNEEGWGRG